jgi:hypothetical protein
MHWHRHSMRHNRSFNREWQGDIDEALQYEIETANGLSDCEYARDCADYVQTA